MTAKSFDPECHRLAMHFLAGEAPSPTREAEANELAQEIQNAVESWFDYRDADDEEPESTI